MIGAVLLLAMQVLQPSAGLKLGPPKVLSLGPPTEAKPKHDERLTQAGFHRKLKPDALKAGKWEKVTVPLWRLAIRSPGAKAVRAHFTDAALGSAKLWVHDGRGQTFGPYITAGDFWSDIIAGDTLIIELQSARKLSKLPFRVPEISHLTQD